MAMHELLPFKQLIQAFLHQKDQKFSIFWTVFEDNVGALALAKLDYLG